MLDFSNYVKKNLFHLTHDCPSLVAQTINKHFTCRRSRFDFWVGKIPWRRAWQPTPVSWPGEVHGQRSLVGYIPLDTTEWLTLTNPLLGFPSGSDSKESPCNAGDLGLIPMSERSPGQVNGYPLQYSCLDNMMDRGAWWATFYGVKNWIWLSD